MRRRAIVNAASRERARVRAAIANAKQEEYYQSDQWSPTSALGYVEPHCKVGAVNARLDLQPRLTKTLLPARATETQCRRATLPSRGLSRSEPAAPAAAPPWGNLAMSPGALLVPAE